MPVPKFHISFSFFTTFSATKQSLNQNLNEEKKKTKKERNRTSTVLPYERSKARKALVEDDEGVSRRGTVVGNRREEEGGGVTH